MASLLEILSDDGIALTETHLVCLDDVVYTYIQSTNPKLYMRKIGCKEKIDGRFYVKQNKCLELIKKGKSDECKKMIERLNGHNSVGQQMMNMFNINEGILRIGGVVITCVYDFTTRNKNVWMKAKDITSLLKYENSKNAIYDHVEDENKMSYGDLDKMLKTAIDTSKGSETIPFEVTGIPIVKNINMQTIFINISGLFSLIMDSKMKEAKGFKSWVVNDVLPALYDHGSYTINTTPLDFKDVSESIVINNYHKKKVIYIGYIGKFAGEDIFKFGKTKDIYDRKKAHKSTYGSFNLLYVRETTNNDEIESMIIRNIAQFKIARIINYSEQNRTELFTITDKHTITDIQCMFDELIDKFKLPLINELESKIKEKELLFELMETKLNGYIKDTRKYLLKYFIKMNVRRTTKKTKISVLYEKFVKDTEKMIMIDEEFINTISCFVDVSDCRKYALDCSLKI